MLKRTSLRFYTFLITIPDCLYPFSCTIEGKRVRWRAAYEQVLTEVRARMGAGHYGATLFAYRQVFHVVGSVLFMTTATFIAHRLFGSDTALLVLLGTATLAITFQEFYVHPRHYGQRLPKSVTDWLAWVAPMGSLRPLSHLVSLHCLADSLKDPHKPRTICSIL